MLTHFDKLCQIKNGIEKNGFDLQRCIQRHKSPLTALKTRVFPPPQPQRTEKTRCAVCQSPTPLGKPSIPEKLSRAGIGFMPIGKNGHCLEYLQPNPMPIKTGRPPTALLTGNQSPGATHTASKSIPASPADTSPASILNTKSSTTTRSPSLRHSQSYVQTHKNPLLVISKSGGLRFECRTARIRPSEKRPKSRCYMEKSSRT